MNEILSIARLKIRDGKLEEFKRVAGQCTEVAKTKDTGTLQYDLYLNQSQTECLVIERYRDSPALMEHLNNLGKLMDAMLETCTASGELCGNVAPELVQALEGAPVQLFKPYQSFKPV